MSKAASRTHLINSPHPLPNYEMGSRVWRSAFPSAALVLVAGFVSGCVTRSKADMQARMAYLAGKRDAYMEIQEQRARGPAVNVIGPVTDHIIKWIPGLSLSQAIVKAGYIGTQDPKEIVIHRNGQDIQVDPKQLLSGQVVPLEIGDLVELKD